MPNFRDTREILYLSHFDNNIEDEEFMILLELVKSKNRDLPYSTYPFKRWLPGGISFDEKRHV